MAAAVGGRKLGLLGGRPTQTQGRSQMPCTQSDFSNATLSECLPISPPRRNHTRELKSSTFHRIGIIPDPRAHKAAEKSNSSRRQVNSKVVMGYFFESDS